MLTPLKKTTQYLSIALLVLLISSCEQKKSPLAVYGPIFEDVILSDKGTFREFNLGDSLLTILKKEHQQPIEKDSNYLYYEYKIDSITTFNIKYNFDERGLNEVESDIFILNNMNLAEDTFNKFKTYLNQHYGESETKGGFNVWSVKSEKYGDVMINLSNEFPAFNAKNNIGKISLWIYPDNY